MNNLLFKPSLPAVAAWRRQVKVSQTDVAVHFVNFVPFVVKNPPGACMGDRRRTKSQSVAVMNDAKFYKVIVELQPQTSDLGFCVHLCQSVAEDWFFHCENRLSP